MRRSSFTAAVVGVGLLVALGVAASDARAATASGDNLRTGWYPDQASLTPALVSGGTFGQLFVTTLQDQIYAQPLVANGVLFIATEANWIYGLDPETGAVRWSRNLGTPWNAADIGCGDLVPTVGITGTPVIDEVTGTAYFFSKTYANGTSGEAAWFAHAVDVSNGNERSGFPVPIQGTSQNNPLQTFNPTTQLQRPGLLLMDGVVYAAFGGHCDINPYQGWIAGITPSGQLHAWWVTMGGEGISGASVWQSGGGLVSDGSGRIIFATGNGGAPTTPTPGNQPPASLGESVTRVQVQPNGTLAAADFFVPFDASHLDSLDLDFGSGGPVALPSAYFGTPMFPNLLVEAGKEGYVYLLSRDSLGGFQQGTGGGDNVVQRLGPSGGVWARISTWPGDGGYVYIPTASTGSSGSGSGGYLQYYKYGVDVNGRPTFSLTATSADTFGFTSSGAVVTSNSTNSGSALVWIVWAPNGSGSGAQLRCYDPVPVNGVPTLRWSAPVGISAKFNPPGVGPNGRIYVGTREGKVFGFGAPVTLPLTGSTLVFPSTVIGTSSTLDDVLTAQGDITVTSLSTTASVFTLGTPTPSLPATLHAGQTLTVPVTFTPTQLGLTAGQLVVNTSAGQQQFGLQGTGQASGPVLTATPAAVSFGGTVVGGHLTSVVTYSNQGSSALTISGSTLPAAPFSASGVPPTGYVMNPGDSLPVNVYFDPTSTGTFTDNLVLNSTGGNVTTPLSGSAQFPSQLSITPLSLTYGSVAAGSSVTASFTLKNVGNSTITITKSKPPVRGQFFNLTNLYEGTTIAPGQVLTETVQFSPTKLGYQTDGWVINSDSTSGLQTVTFNGFGMIPPPPSGGWTVNGSASLAGTSPGSLLILTPNSADQAGSAFWSASVDPTNLSVEFDATIDQGTATGADGLMLAITDPARGASTTSLGDNGGAMGFSGIPGIGVALDTYRNANDPSSNFVGVTDGPVNPAVTDALHWFATATNIPPLRPATRHISVRTDGGVVSVSVDGVAVISTPVTFGSTALVGFTGGTGSVTDRHAVSNVSISGHDLGPTLTATAVPATGMVHLAWTGGSAPYTLQRALDPGFTLGVQTLVSGSAVSFDDPVLNDPTMYYYRLQ